MSAPIMSCYRGCCTEWEQEIQLYMDHELSPDRCEQVQRHLDQCDTCARYYRVVHREDQLLSGRIRHQVELTADPKVIADLVMSDIPAFQTMRWQQRFAESCTAVVFYLFDQNRWHYSMAATILVCVMGILFAMRVGNVTEDPDIHLVRFGKLISVPLRVPILISQDEGEFIQLPDESVLYATKETVFSIDSYPENNGEETIDSGRRLKLIMGAICLDVRRWSNRIGFSVECSNAVAKVFGTQFYMSTSSNPKVTIVGVRSGGVMVEKKGKNQIGFLLLEPRYMTTVTNFNGNVNLKLPRLLSNDIRKLLDRFNEQLTNRSARRMLPILPHPEKDMVLTPSLGHLSSFSP